MGQTLDYLDFAHKSSFCPYGAQGLHGPGPMGQGRWASRTRGLGDPGPQGPRASGPMGPQGLHGPRGPPVGVYTGARGRWGPKGSMGLGDPPVGVYTGAPWGYNI